MSVSGIHKKQQFGGKGERISFLFDRQMRCHFAKCSLALIFALGVGPGNVNVAVSMSAYGACTWGCSIVVLPMY